MKGCSQPNAAHESAIGRLSYGWPSHHPLPVGVPEIPVEVEMLAKRTALKNAACRA